MLKPYYEMAWANAAGFGLNDFSERRSTLKNARRVAAASPAFFEADIEGRIDKKKK